MNPAPASVSDANQSNPNAAADQRLYSVLLNLETAARQQKSIDDLRFQIVNETHRLLGYFQCFTWKPAHSGKVRVTAVSGVSEVDQNAPVVVAMNAIVNAIRKLPDHKKILAVQPEDLGPKIAESWNQWFPEYGLWCPFIDRDGRVFGGYFTTREHAYRSSEVQATGVITDAYSHAWRALQPRSRRRGLLRTIIGRTTRWLLFGLTIAAMFMPVRQSVLAPAEIVPLNPVVVTSPLEGVIAQFNVQPNASVSAGQELFQLDSTKARSDLSLAESALRVAEADYRRATNKAFHDRRSKAERQTYKLRVEEKKLERDFNAAQLEKTLVRANRDGIAVFNEVNDWIGQPVQVGERIMTLANPEQTEIEIWLSVADGTNLEPGADVELFLNIDPATPVTAKIRQTSYKPAETPNGDLGFRLKAELLDTSSAARLGLKGTAKIYGEQVSLFYFLFRRPWSVFRQKFGI